MDKNKIIELLPWYVNNSLDEEETRMVDEALKNNNDLKKEYELFISLSSNIKSDQSASPGEIGLARLKRSMKAAQKTTDKPYANGWKLAAIAASLVIVLQLGLMLNPDSTQPYYEPLGNSNTLKNTIAITLSATATEQQIRSVLLDSDAIIIDGPSAAGIYRLRSTAEIDATIQSLQSHPEIVTHVQTE